MNPQLETQLKNLYTKLQQLLKQNQLLQKQNADMKLLLEEKDTTIAKLQQQADVFKLNANALDEKEKEQLRKRIDLYLAEIDKCLALMNE
jgi:TolA-binding protein